MKAVNSLISIASMFIYVAAYMIFEALNLNFSVLYAAAVQLVLILIFSFVYKKLVNISTRRYFALAILPQFVIYLIAIAFFVVNELVYEGFIDFGIKNNIIYTIFSTSIEILILGVILLIKEENFKSAIKLKYIIISAISMLVALMLMCMGLLIAHLNASGDMIFYFCFIIATLIHFLLMFAFEKSLTKFLGATVVQYYFWAYIVFVLGFSFALSLCYLLSIMVKQLAGLVLICILLALLVSAIGVSFIPACIRVLASKVKTKSVRSILYVFMALIILISTVSGYIKIFHNTHIKFNDVFVRKSPLSTVKEVYGEFDHIEKDAFDCYWGHYK